MLNPNLAYILRANFFPSGGLSMLFQNSQRFPWNAMLLGKIRRSDFPEYMSMQKFLTTHQITSTQELTDQLKNTAL